jgi:hypothetical protein
MIFRLDSKIVEILAVHHLPEGAAAPPVTTVGSSAIGIGPASLHRDFHCAVTMLTSGRPTEATANNTISATTDILPLSARETGFNVSLPQLLGWFAIASLTFFIAYRPEVAADVASGIGEFFTQLVR